VYPTANHPDEAMVRTHPTPLRLAQRTVAGSALIASSCLFTLLPFHAFPEHLSFFQAVWNQRAEILAVVTPFLAGMTLGLLSPSQLAKGMRNDLWTEKELEEARVWIHQRIFSYLSGALVFTFVGYGIYCIAEHRHLGGSYLFIYALNPYSTIARHLRNPTPSRNLSDWQASRPIHSDHWGHPTS
jgi:hypothetical protein